MNDFISIWFFVRCWLQIPPSGSVLSTGALPLCPSLSVSLSLSCAYASTSVSLGLPVSLSLPLCSLPVPTLCLPMCLPPLLSLCFSLQLPTSKPASVSPVCFSLSHYLFPTSVWVSSMCLGLRESPSPPPVHPGSPPQPQGLGIITQRPCPIQRRPLCSLLPPLAAHPPGLAFSSSFPGPKARQPKMWENVAPSLGLRHQEAQDGCQSWNTPTQPLGPLGRQPPPPLSPPHSP